MNSLKYQIGVQAFLPSSTGQALIKMDIFNEDMTVVKLDFRIIWGNFQIICTALSCNRTWEEARVQTWAKIHKIIIEWPYPRNKGDGLALVISRGLSESNANHSNRVPGCKDTQILKPETRSSQGNYNVASWSWFSWAIFTLLPAGPSDMCVTLLVTSCLVLAHRSPSCLTHQHSSLFFVFGWSSQFTMIRKP